MSQGNQVGDIEKVCGDRSLRRTLGATIIACLSLFVWLGLCWAAAAEQTCWAPDRSEPPDQAVARAAPIAALNADVAAVSDALKRNPALLRIPNTRLGITSYIGYPNEGFGHAVRVSAGLYPPNTWRANCTLMKGPEFFNQGHVHVTFNEPQGIFRGMRALLSDSTLTAYPEPFGAMRVGEEMYYDSLRGVVLTPERVPAWVSVTRAEYLAFRERETQQVVENLERKARELESSVERYRAEMGRRIERTRDAQQQAQLQAAMESNLTLLTAANAEAAKEHARLREETMIRLQAIRDERTRLSHDQLEEQARVNDTPLVKLNPALSGGHRRVNLIVVNAVANDNRMWEPLKAAVREVDYAALRALLR